MKKLDRIVKVAAEEAAKSSYHYKMGAVIFKQGKVISKGYNDTKRGFSGYRGYWEGSLHAEIAALVKSRTDVSGCSILVHRRYSGDSHPCNSCMAALKSAGIKNIFYSEAGTLLKEKL